MKMNHVALRSAIFANANCQPYIVTNDMPKQNAASKDQSIADILNAPAGTRLTERWVNAIGIVSALGAETGATILNKIKAAQAQVPAIEWVLPAIISENGINMGDAETQNTLTNLALGGILTQIEADAVKNLAVQPSSAAYESVGQTVTAADVSIALRFNADFAGA